MKNRQKPAIRFKGFTEDWEQRKLGELALFNPKDELPQIFEYVDLESVVGTEMLSHRTEIKSSAPSRAQRIARTGDLFYQTVRPYQKNNYLFEKPDNNYVFSTGYAQMRPFVDGYFMLSLVQSERFIKVVLDNCTGTSYPAINSNNLAEIEVYAPSNKKEDNKIGTIFRNIDNLITLHQRKYDKLVNIKKSMLEKMFPREGKNVPDIRFSGFTEDWEQRKVGDYVDITTGKLDANAMKEDGKYDFYTSGIQKYKIDVSAFEGPAITIAGNGATVGYMHLADGKFNAYQRTYVLTDFQADRHFLFFEIGNKLPKKITQEARTGNIPYIVMDMLTNLQIVIPEKSEQEKIGQYIQQLDNLITLHQRKLEKLKYIKKSCLEKMFI